MSDEPPLIGERFDEELIHGYCWKSGNEEELAILVAKLLLGQHRHVRKIMEGVSSPNPSFTKTMVEHTLNKLAPSSDAAKLHRDGWLFQIIAWIGIRIADRGQLLISPPHDRPADKGFDALVIKLSKDSATPVAMMICEEKATENPRNKFQQQVLHEFRDCKSGARDAEIKSELTTLLEASVADEDVDEFLDLVMWQRERAYRVCLTIPESDPDNTYLSKLFKGFDDEVDGSVSQRRAETFHVEQLRDWMDRFAEKVTEQLKSMKGGAWCTIRNR